MCQKLIRWLTWATVEQVCEEEPLTQRQKFWRRIFKCTNLRGKYLGEKRKKEDIK